MTSAPAAAVMAMGFFLPVANLIPSRLQRIRDENATRNRLWNRFYGNDWGEVTTNVCRSLKRASPRTTEMAALPSTGLSYFV